MAAIRTFLLSSSVLVAVAGCGPIGGVEPGDPTAGRVNAPRDVLPSENMETADPVVTGNATAENSGGACPVPASMPGAAALTPNEALPDPFSSLDGTRITRKDQWTCRRAEIAAQVQQYELGPKPERPSIVTGTFADNVLSITTGEEGKTIDFTVDITRPANAPAGPIPALIAIGGNSLDASVFAERGIATIAFKNGEMGAQGNMQGMPSTRGQGKFYELYGANHGAGSMMAWAWGVSRIIDALESTPDANIDTKHLAVTGCSRNGKGALVVGAFDERITLTIPQESGAGGSAAWRISRMQNDAALAANPAATPNNGRVQLLVDAQGEQPWFREAFSQFNNIENRLPYDHHMVLGLVAPRALFVIDNSTQIWLGSESSYTDSVVASEIWKGLGLSGMMGASQVGDHDHCAFPASQRTELAAFVDRFLLDDAAANTVVMR
ncbi:MAG TPA: hypothetical protein VJU61_18645, partial [Polyangiaceae bacterium]|nr:hypothetical protein [Polyangiaceae bacterium]